MTDVLLLLLLKNPHKRKYLCLLDGEFFSKVLFVLVIKYRGVVVITTTQLHSSNPELRFCAGSNPAHGVSEIRDGEDL